MLAVFDYLSVPMNSAIGELILIAIIFGALYGLFQGVIDFFVEKKLIEKGSLGRYLIFKFTFSMLLSVAFFWGSWFLLSQQVLNVSFLDTRFVLSPASRQYFFLIYLIFYFIMNLILIFINQVNKKYGPGVLVPLLLGKYSSPVEEERIFMFMDLKSSTSLAESFGHIRYSEFIRDSFLDINHVLAEYNAEVYQYVGDEVVLSWEMTNGVKETSCIWFFFACEKRFAQRSAYYIKKYGTVPAFKAGLHAGKVTAVEIGNIKREIAYHGDILNAAARIQSLCNEYGKKFLVSADFLDGLLPIAGITVESLGHVRLRGKQNEMAIVSVEVRALQ
jgi:adenylate cyclase